MKMRQDTSTLSASRAMTGKFGCGTDTRGMSQVKPKSASHLIGAHECRRLHSRLVDYLPASLGSFAGRGEMTLSALSAKRPFAHSAANSTKEPIVTDAA